MKRAARVNVYRLAVRGLLWTVPLVVWPAVLRAEERAVAPVITVATYNILHGGVWSGWIGTAQHLDQRFELVAATLEKLHLDILGVQEASTSRERGNTAARLATRLGLSYVYAPAAWRLFRNEDLNRVLSGFLNFTEGPAILSRFPIVSWTAYDLPRCGRWLDPRVLLVATLHTPWGFIQVASTHTSGDPCQHRALLTFLLLHRDTPLLLMGDFNAVEHSQAMTMFTAEHGFIDIFRTLHPTSPGFTCYQNPYAPAPTVSRRIDYLLLLPSQNFQAQLRTSMVILDAPGRLSDGRPLWPSDHYGVVAEIELSPPVPSGGSRQSYPLRQRTPSAESY